MIKVGVKDFCFELSTKCGEKKAQVSMDFFLEGDFLPAAQSDDLKKSVDYYALSMALKEKLKDRSCRSQMAEATRLILEFSPLITAVYVKITALCHGALIVEQSLLKPEL